MSMMVVMKFGGTSVQDAKAIDRVCMIVRTRLDSGQRPVVVLSAIAKGTDALIEAGALASEGKISEAREKIAKLRERHLQIARELVKDEKSFGDLRARMGDYFNDLEDLLKGVSLLSELSTKIQAKIVSYGELLATLIASYAMRERGMSAALLDARDFIITDNNYLKGEPQLEEIIARTKVSVGKVVEAGMVPVIQGFISRSKDGMPSVLGRGGSDYTASLVGMALDAKEIEIWTDVDGMLTADPRKVQGTKIISEISFEEAAELAYFGAKVLHPLTIRPAVEKSIPVRIKNSQAPEVEGTLILNRTGDHDAGGGARAVKSIACKEKVIVINIFSMRMLNSYGFLKKIFDVFDKHRTSVDLITTSEVNVSVTLDNGEYLEEIKTELSAFAKVSVENDKALVCLVGNNLKNTQGITGKIFGVLSDYKITMISQGASLINVSFVLDQEHLKEALQKLHNTFFKN
ncbi:MAG: lysine-sensitive aspartokinase 3 [Oligoflexia bacterium]|nr:lysine-sensitive aspartokinase 3 [Oligoflexia bacterium]MBF0366729.1 lysine-sensitive aspartokinase 3 [Oligoflexia bacterium]